VRPRHCFGNQKDDSFAGILGNILQSFGGEYLYPSIEEQAAHLLYFVIKNHPFSDGNKRIGAFLFIWFLQRNQHHLKSDGELKINDNALAAIALLVAQSDPAQKHLMIHLIMNLIRGSYSAHSVCTIIAKPKANHERNRLHRLPCLELLYHAARRWGQLWRLSRTADLPDLPENGRRVRSAALQPQDRHSRRTMPGRA
jgi:death-on-curing family protein